MYKTLVIQIAGDLVRKVCFDLGDLAQLFKYTPEEFEQEFEDFLDCLEDEFESGEGDLDLVRSMADLVSAYEEVRIVRTDYPDECAELGRLFTQLAK